MAKTIKFRAPLVLVLLTALLLESFSFGILKWGFEVSPRPSEEDNLFHPFTGWVQKPSIRISATKACLPKSEIQTDLEGNSITPSHEGKATFNVVILGGSSTFGLGSSENSQTLPSHLERILNERLALPGHSIEVKNLAVRGYQSFQEMLRLHEYLARSNPTDLVISFGGSNDAYSARVESDESSLLPKKIWKKTATIRRLEQGRLTLLNLESSLSRVSFTARLFSVGYHLLFPPPKEIPPYEEMVPAITSRVELNLLHHKLMEKISQQYGASFYYFLQPTGFSKLHLAPDEQACIQTSVDMVPKWDVFQRQYYETMRQRLNNKSQLDFSKMFNSYTEALFVDHVHYNDKGAEIIAEKIANFLLPQIKEKLKERRKKASQDRV